MIIVKLQGGIGNQLFQYALGRCLSFKKNTELKLDISSFKNNPSGITPRKYGLSVFNINESFATDEEIARAKRYQRQQGKWRFVYNRLVANQNKYFQEQRFDFDSNVFKVFDDCYFDGYWQTEKYFKDVENIIRHDLTIRTPQQSKDSEIAEKIQSVSSIALHIRRGDYVSDPATADYFGTCCPDYYRNAVKVIAEEIQDPHLFVFSDDPEWVKKNIILPYPTTYVNHNNSEKSFEDLRMMSQCKHFVIANSSFSWWGAWLSQNPNKIVVGPKNWFNNVKPGINTKDIMPQNWIKI